MRLSKFPRRVFAALTREKGQALPLFAAGLVGFCGLVGLSIDVGQLVFTATDMQKVADASALAAGQDLPGTTTATSTANSYATQNGGATIAVAFSDSNYTVTVDASRQVDYTFLRVLGMSGKNVKRSATVHTTRQPVTGYELEHTAPFVLWGGTRSREVPAGSNACPLHMCVGKQYTFYSPNWKADNGRPTVPGWTNTENNFKGSIAHGDGAAISEVGDTLSVGGMGSPPLPAVGDIIVIPVVDTAGGNADEYKFHVAAWVQLRVTSCSLTICSGELLDPNTTPAQPGWVGGGSTQPPPSLTYTGTTTTLTK